MYNPNMGLTLKQALRMDRPSCAAFIGSGGKTTAIFQLARQLSSPVIVTATSHLGAWQTQQADRHVIVDQANGLPNIENGVPGVVLITGPQNDDRMLPVSREALMEIFHLCQHKGIPLLIEADGSRLKPLKGWASHEPPIPDFADHIVLVAGMSGLGKTLSDRFVHRAEVFAELGKLDLGAEITAEALTGVLVHEQGARRNFPTSARKSVILNQADTLELQGLAQGMVPSLLQKYDSTIIASLRKNNLYAAHESIAGIILAAGASTRYGAPKQLLDWKGEPFVRVITRRALEAGLYPVLVIVGAQVENIRDAVKDLNVRVIQNNEWASGQASSIKTGIFSLHTASDMRPGGAIFLLSDQPQVTTSVLHALVASHAEGLHPVIAPMVSDRRANPVLFDRSTFSDLLTLEGDVGGRAIFHKHRVEYIPWHDDRLLLDVDTPEHYQRLRADDTL